jgi:hypothetical protein
VTRTLSTEGDLDASIYAEAKLKVRHFLLRQGRKKRSKDEKRSLLSDQDLNFELTLPIGFWSIIGILTELGDCLV